MIVGSGWEPLCDFLEIDYEPPGDAHRMVQALHESLGWLRDEVDENTPLAELVEAYHDVESIHQEASTLFSVGYLSLEDNARVERLYWSACSAALKALVLAEADEAVPELLELEEKLVDQYLCNFSVFQSMRDHWAIRFCMYAQGCRIVWSRSESASAFSTRCFCQWWGISWMPGRSTEW